MATKVFQVDTSGTLTTGLQAYYKLEDATDFYSTNNLTNNNAATFSAGKINNAVDFGASNTNKYLNIASNLGIQGGAASIAGWVNITTAPATNGNRDIVNLASNVSGATAAYLIAYQDSSGTKRLRFARARACVGDQEFFYNTTLTVGTWYHVAITYDGTTVIGYFNGTNVGSVAASGNATCQGNGFFIGINDAVSAGNYLSGLVDETGVWNKALSTQEITDLYNSGNGQTMIEEQVINNSNLLLMGVS